jgi:hypothetical protein
MEKEKVATSSSSCEIVIPILSTACHIVRLIFILFEKSPIDGIGALVVDAEL